MKKRTAIKADGVIIGVFFTLTFCVALWAVHGVYRASVVASAGDKACNDLGLGAWHIDIINEHKARAFCGTAGESVAHIIEVNVP